ncbi:TetR/AcrR family transcriptional regulator [Epibacterium ulvae]|nr:TetR/AcrR family transcriptional regulator [Epibacterium ulvae]
MTRSGRPRSFDEDTALKAAMRAFWVGGYAGTTYNDLEKETGLRRQSLTYAFGDKPDLFRRALSHYIDERVARAAELLSKETSFLENLRYLLDAWEADATSGSGRGCFLVRSTAELGPDAYMAQELQRGDNILLNALTDAFRRAEEHEGLVLKASPEALARLVISVGNGAMVQAVARQDTQVSRTAHDALFSLIS